MEKSEIIFLFLNENDLEPSRRVGSNERSQCMFVCKNKGKHPFIIPITPFLFGALYNTVSF